MTPQTYECDRCGRLGSHVNAVHTGIGCTEEWCDACVAKHTFECMHCHNLTDGCYAETVRAGFYERTYCPDCAHSHATMCYCCNDSVINHEVHRVYIWGTGYRDVCESCLEDYYRCSRCGKYCTEDDIEYLDGYYYCPDCAPTDYLSDYHHTEGISFLTNGEPEPLYLGVELEMEFDHSSSRSEAARMICTSEAYGSLYDCKEDGSLSDYGMEVVTQPATPLYHLSGYDQVILDAARECGAVSHDSGNCGLHIHIDRGFFERRGNQRAAWRAGFIMDSIISANEPYILRFTRRTYSQLNHWASLMNMTPAKAPKSLDAKLADYRSAKYTRYQAVNMENYDTIELRLFRGTLNNETFYATVEFTAALAYLTRALLPIPEYASTLGWDDLKLELFAALELEGIRSKELSAYLKRRSL